MRLLVVLLLLAFPAWAEGFGGTEEGFGRPVGQSAPRLYDGTNDYMTRGANLTGVADGKSGTVSVWLRIDGGDGSGLRIMENDVSGFLVLKGADNVLQVLGRNAADSDILSLFTVSTFTASSTWIHLLASWDLAAGVGFLYVDDVSDVSEGGKVLTNDSVDYAGTNWAVGSYTDGSLKFNGCIAELWFDLTYIDLSVVANRRKFRTAAGRPANLGPDGSYPTGSRPILYVHRHHPTTDGVNYGSGGDFTVTGSLAACDSRP